MRKEPSYGEEKQIRNSKQKNWRKLAKSQLQDSHLIPRIAKRLKLGKTFVFDRGRLA